MRLQPGFAGSRFGIRSQRLPDATEFGQHSGDNPLKRRIKLPKRLSMTSEYVARRTVGLAKHPRRALVIPGYYRLIVAFETLFPGLVDWILKVAFVRRFHRPTTDVRP